MINDRLQDEGLLTSTGFAQHLIQGSKLRKSRPDFFSKINRDQVYIRSTRYPRTIQSAAALIHGIFNDNSTNEIQVSNKSKVNNLN